MRCWPILLLITLACPPCLASEDGYEHLVDLPIHNFEYATDLLGKLQIIPGEYVTWHYPFEWSARSDSGGRIALNKGDEMRFLGRPSSRSISMELPDKMRVVAYIPPNLPSHRAAFRLRPIALTDAIGTATADIIVNRIGNPESIQKYLNFTAYIYSSGIITEHWTEDRTVTHKERYYDYRSSSYRTEVTTEEIEVDRKRSFVPYDFEIRFDKENRLQGFQDTSSNPRGVARHHIDLGRK